MPAAHLALVLLINLAWGGNLVLTKIAVATVPPVLFSALRFALLVVVLAPFLKRVPGRGLSIAGIGVGMGILHFSLVYAGLGLADDVSTVAIATQLMVPFATLLSVVFLGERIGWRRVTGIGMAFAGMLVIGFDPAVFDYAAALLLVAAGALAAACGIVLTKRAPDVPVFTLQAWIAVIAAPGLLAISAVFESDRWTALAEAPPSIWWILVFSALGAGLLGHGGMTWLLKRHDVGVISPLTLLSTVFGIALGVTVLGDELTPRIVAGSVLALGGVLIVARRQPRRSLAPALQSVAAPNRADDHQ